MLFTPIRQHAEIFAFSLEASAADGVSIKLTIAKGKVAKNDARISVYARFFYKPGLP
jgi:hypothetical protein